MKKFIKILSVLLLVFSLVSCAKKDATVETPKNVPEYYGKYQFSTIDGGLLDGMSEDSIKNFVASMRARDLAGYFVIGEESYLSYRGEVYDLTYEEVGETVNLTPVNKDAFSGVSGDETQLVIQGGELLMAQGNDILVYEKVADNIKPESHYGRYEIVEVRESGSEDAKWQTSDEFFWYQEMDKNFWIELDDECSCYVYNIYNYNIEGCDMDYETSVLTVHYSDGQSDDYHYIEFTDDGLMFYDTVYVARFKKVN